MENKMFCYQCQETAQGRGCTVAGVCGKNAEVAAMQDLLIYVTKGLSAVTTALREQGVSIDASVKGGLHSVKATEKFKMALLLTLE